MTDQQSKRWMLIFAVTSAQFAVPFMISSVGVALPVIGREFAADGVTLSLVESVFLGVSAMCVLVFGRASDMIGRAWIFLGGLTIFSLATVALGFTQSIEALIAVRAVQAFGGAMQMSSSLAILIEGFPPQKRGRVLGIALAGVYLGISAGPFLGGLITHAWGWRWVFFLGAIPCFSALFMGFTIIERDFRRSVDPFDWTGTFVSMLTIGLFVIGGANMNNALGLPLIGISVVALIVFLKLESQKPYPLLDLNLFRSNATFRNGNLLQFFNYSSTFGMTFLMSLYLQFGHGMSPATAGRILVIQPLIQSALSPLCGRLADRFSSGPLVTGGMLLNVVGLGWASTFNLDTPILSVMLVLGILGLGIALFAAPNMNLIMSSIRTEQNGVATAVTGQMRTLGMTTGMVAISMALAYKVGDQVLNAASFPAFNQAMQLILLGFCATAVLGTALSLRIFYKLRKPALNA